MEGIDQDFVLLMFQASYRMVSDAAARRGMTPDEYASLAIQRQIAEDEQLRREPEHEEGVR